MDNLLSSLHIHGSFSFYIDIICIFQCLFYQEVVSPILFLNYLLDNVEIYLYLKYLLVSLLFQ